VVNRARREAGDLLIVAPDPPAPLWLLSQPPAQTVQVEPSVLPITSVYCFARSVSSPALPGPRNSRWFAEPWARHPESCLAIFSGAPGRVRYHTFAALEPCSLPATSGCQNEVSTQWMRHGWSMRCRRAPASDRCRDMPVHPRPRTVRTSLGSLYWSCASPATLDLQLMAPERPQTMVQSLEARFTKYHSSLVTGLYLPYVRAVPFVVMTEPTRKRVVVGTTTSGGILVGCVRRSKTL
jgi:hypothetical protein